MEGSGVWVYRYGCAGIDAGFQIQLLGPGWTSAFNHAVDTWNAAFASYPNIPRIEPRQGGFSVSSVSSGACGGALAEKDVPEPAISLTFNGGNCSTAAMDSIALHELTAIYGFVDEWEAWGKFSGDFRTDPIYNGHCAISTGGAPQLCMHEIEMVKYAYGYRSSSVKWSQAFTGTLLPVQASITIYRDDVVNPPAWKHRLVSVPGMHCSRPNNQACTSVDTTLSTATITQTSGNLAVVSFQKIDGVTRMIGQGEGTATVTANTGNQRAPNYTAGAMTVTVIDTTSPPPPTLSAPSNFRMSSCTVQTGPAAKLRFAWTPGNGATWRLVSNAVNNPATAVQENSGNVGVGSATVAPRPPSDGIRYFWIRNELSPNVSSWVGPVYHDYSTVCTL